MNSVHVGSSTYSYNDLHGPSTELNTYGTSCDARDEAILLAALFFIAVAPVNTLATRRCVRRRRLRRRRRQISRDSDLLDKET